MQESLSKFACEQWLREVSEELFDHVCHVICRLFLVVHIVWGVLVHLPQRLNARLNPRLTEQTHLESQGQQRDVSKSTPAFFNYSQLTVQ